MTQQGNALQAILDSFAPHACSVLNDVAANEAKEFESIRKQPFFWEGMAIMATTSAKRYFGDYRLVVQFEYVGSDRRFRLFTAYPELRTILKDSLQSDDSVARWEVLDREGYMGDEHLTLIVSRLP